MSKGFVSKILASSIAGITLFPAIQAGAIELEEVIVTAQKREQSLQDTPVSVTAFTAETARNLGINSISDLAVKTPGLLMTTQVGYVQPYIRGVGNDITQGVESSVAVHIDGVYIKNILSMEQNLSSMERIEVLRGPQGTLYGRNATGGAINILTKDPHEDTEGNIEVGYGNYADSQLSAYFNGGLTDNLAANVTIGLGQKESYIDNLSTAHDEIDDSENVSLRGKLKYMGSDNFSAVLTLSHEDRNQDELMVRSQVQQGSLGQMFGPFLGGGNQTDQPHKAYTDNDNKLEHEQNMAFLHLNWYGDDFDVKSISSYQENEQKTWTDFDGTDAPLFNFNVKSEFETWTQEFQLVSKPESDYQWIVGLFYLHDEGGFDPVTLDLGPAAGGYETFENNTTDAYAAFGQITVPLTEQLSITAGLRYSDEEKDQDYQYQIFNLVDNGLGYPEPPMGFTTPRLPSRAESWDSWTPKLSLEYQVSDNTLAWISYSEGFKSGGFNTVNVPSGVVDPEEIEAWEIGLKTDLLEDRVRLNATAFHYDFTNQQVQVTDPQNGGALVVNAAESSMKGFEIETTAIVSDFFSIDAGMSYIDAEYDKYDDASSYAIGQFYVVWQDANFDGLPDMNEFVPTGVNTPFFSNAAGNHTVKTPELTFNISPTLEIPTDSGLFILSAIYSYTDDFYFRPDNSPESKQKSYGLLNASATFRDASDQWYVQLWGNNLTDEEYNTFIDINVLGQLKSYGPPRTYGVRVGYNF